MADPQSALAMLSNNNVEYADLIKQIPVIQNMAEARLQQVASFFPSHSKAIKVAGDDSEKQHKTL
ncbi:MAG: hypothetical protein WBM38_04320 [Arenicellales bacterium]